MNTWLDRCLEHDHRLSSTLGARGNGRLLRIVFTVLSHSGDSLIWLAIGVLLWRFSIGFWAQMGERILLATAITWALSSTLKFFVRRPRPEGKQGLFYLNLDRHSFPSGHATRMGGLFMALAPIVPGWAALGLWLWGALVSVSRVFLGLHYVGDIVVGWLMGLLASLALLLWVF